ncbi:mechanosensitive ion channel [Candidatus Bathyarchaeota archaeon]|nr:mechanosensitive ion channel [Candidatus Bathyarchaeota archaeon]
MFGDYLNRLLAWIDSNLGNLIISIFAVGILFIIYKFLGNQVDRLKKKENFDDNSSFLIKRILTWVFYITSGVIVFNTLGLRIDFFIGLWVLAGGTIIGFASINTIGNAIAGLILMLSRPFKIGDRLYFQEEFVDVEDIDLIYTRMRTTDNILISVPNQVLIESVIHGYGVNNVIRRRAAVTAGYDVDPITVRKALMDAISSVDNVMGEPSPYVWVTDLQNFAMEYTLFYYLGDSKSIIETDSSIKAAIYAEFTKAGIDLTTPNIVQSVGKSS